MLERKLEDYICQHPELLNLAEASLDNVRIIERQVVLPHGILDILAFRSSKKMIAPEVLVVELKAVKIKEKDIAQVCRYVYDIHEILFAPIMFYGQTITGSPIQQHLGCVLENMYSGKHVSPIYSNRDGGIVPILVGYECPDESVLVAALAAGIEIYGYWLNDTGISIKLISNENNSLAIGGNDWAQQITGLMYNEISRINDYTMVQSFFERILQDGKPYSVEIAVD